MLKFITGNKTKFKEVQAVLAPIKVKQIDINLPEIQELNSRKIIKHKLREAFKRHKGEFIIDDSSLYLKCFGYKLPGPLVKWFNDTIGSKGYAELVKRMGDNRATAKTIIGYAKNATAVLFFEGSIRGKIVAPKGGYNFGYDPIFVPRGKTRTLSEMKARGDFLSSPRGIAILKLKKYLLKHNYHTFA